MAAPIVLAGGVPEALAAVCGVLVALRTGRLPLAIATGVVAVSALRTLS